jgi:hypothetical protein
MGKKLAIYKRISKRVHLPVDKVMTIALLLANEMVIKPAGARVAHNKRAAKKRQAAKHK